MWIGHFGFEGGGAAAIRFEIGELVVHKLYGYRGAIVSIDPVCMAGEKWYQANKTQPPREQPWYHVLVHGSGGLSTYVAQSNLEFDRRNEPIDHPRLDAYFEAFKDGRYVVKAAKSGSWAG